MIPLWTIVTIFFKELDIVWKKKMDNNLHTYCSQFANNDDLDKEEDICKKEPITEWDTAKYPDFDSTPCQHCEEHFANKQALGQHMHIHATTQTTEEESLQKGFEEAGIQDLQFCNSIAAAGHLEDGVMLDVSSNISENLSFYVDGKIVSTSTVNSYNAAEDHAGSSAVVGLDALILDPNQIGHVLNTDSVPGSDMQGQALTKRRTATPPLLPQIKTELESEVVVSSSSTFVSAFIESLLPLNTESTVVQERTVFLSPKLKQLLEKQDGLKPTLALVTDGQASCSPMSLAVLPGSGKFKRRTGSPTGSPQQNPQSDEMPTSDTGHVAAVSPGHEDTPHSSLVHPIVSKKEETTSPVGEPILKPVSTEIWPPLTGGDSCNQQPLDLSNTPRRNDHLASADDVLDLSLQKKSNDKSELTTNIVPQTGTMKEDASNTCVPDRPLQNIDEPNLRTSNHTDFTVITGPDMITPVEPVSDGLVYGLTLPPDSLNSSAASLTPVTLQSASPCTIAFTSSAPHTILPPAPSLITVLASPPPITDATGQPIQMLAPNIPPEPLVICTDNALNSSECDLANAFAATNASNLVTLSHSLDPALNLPGHVFLTDPMALNPPLVDSGPVSEVPFTPVSLGEPLIKSYNITSNTVLIECTIALETPGAVVPATPALEEHTNESPLPAQVVVNHIEQQQIVSVPDAQTADPTILVSSIAESMTLSTTTTSAVSNCPPVAESSPDPEPVERTEPTSVKEQEALAEVVSLPEIPNETTAVCEKTEEDANDAPSEEEQQTFTKNFICNVCDKVFHSMKELGHHVGDHAVEWPYKCEFCVLIFDKPSTLLEHRSVLHGVGKMYICSVCTKEFLYLCNLKHHQEELHPGQQCSYTEEEKGKLRPQNYNNATKVPAETAVLTVPEEDKKEVKKEESEVDVAGEELFTTIKLMASDTGNIKGPDIRLGINQHYPSFKPPPFPYHNKSQSGSLASATNFTTHNIPQTFSTAIRCTKCGKSFDNMPELHKHILACANASDKKRYTPKKNPIPLKHFAKAQNGVLLTTNSANGLNASNRASQSHLTKPNQSTSVKMKFKVLKKRKKRLVQRVMPQRNKSVSSSSAEMEEQSEMFVCPHCRREFTMRRSRTKHMAVCPKKPKEAKKRKDSGISVTKENDGRLHRGMTQPEDKRQQGSPQHKTRFQTSSLGKRHAVIPVQTVFSDKRSKIVIKESSQPKEESTTLNDLPIVRTFNPSMRQYTRVHHNVKGVPIKITIVKPQQTVLQQEESFTTASREDKTGDEPRNSEQSAAT